MMRCTTTVAVLSLALAGCSTKEGAARTDSPAAAAAPATVAQTSAPGEWRSLIDPSLSAWRGYKQASLPSDWVVVGDTLKKVKPTTDLISKDEFGNFELEFSWKLEPGGNAGVFYRGDETNDHIYWSAPEYQLLDDSGHADGRNRLTSAGSFYGLYPTPAGVVKRAGEWNTSRIVARGPHVEHWLNGQKVVDVEIGSPEFDAKVKAGKFAAYPTYARLPRGHLGLQGDHSGALSFHDMRIRSVQ